MISEPLHPDDFDSVTWDAMELLLGTGELEGAPLDLDDDDPDAFVSFRMGDDNPFLRDEQREQQAYEDVRRCLEEFGAEDDEIVRIYYNQ